MQACPGFFLKSLLESPGNLLEICSVKFVDTLYSLCVSYLYVVCLVQVSQSLSVSGVLSMLVLMISYL